MRSVLPLLGAALLGAAPALGCGLPAPVTLATDGPAPSAVLLWPQTWAPGDPAAILAGGAAFRAGCAEPLAAALVEDGILVLALAAAGQGPPDRRLAAALAVLRAGYGAGAVSALLPEPEAWLAAAAR